ncbi:MAG: DUF1844 domain-containing protein [Candidatus Hydrogenedentes bacterium]|nr:DUF1844 domain-containing protein [Candidatus Hydrogenedentota bacterium]
MPDEKPRVIIDEDWKAQVHREKEEAARKAAEAAKQPAGAPAGEAVSGAPARTHAAPEPESEDEALEGEEGPVEASFVTLVASLATQAMFALGVMAPPGARQVMINLDQAKFTIDTLDMLRQKTKGNLVPEEEGALREALAELQRLYAARVQQWQEQTLRQSGIDPTKLKGH